jgi:hypothetical protein
MHEFGVAPDAPQALAALDLPTGSHAPYLPRLQADRELADRQRVAPDVERPRRGPNPGRSSPASDLPVPPREFAHDQFDDRSRA